MSNRETLEAQIPDYTLYALRGWVEEAAPVGDFLRAVLCNDLSDAIGRADVNNKRAMFAIVSWLYNYAPSACSGSVDNYDTWPLCGGLKEIRLRREEAAAAELTADFFSEPSDA